MTEQSAGASGILDGELTREAASARLEAVKQDPKWIEAFSRGSTEHLNEHATLVQAIIKLDVENLEATQAARFGLEREQVVDHYRRTAGVDDPAIAEQIRRNLPVTADEHQSAQDRLHALKNDRAWVTRWLSGDRAAVREKALIDIILARPIKQEARA